MTFKSKALIRALIGGGAIAIWGCSSVVENNVDSSKKIVYEEYYPNGELKSRYYEANGKHIDTSFFFDQNGVLTEKYIWINDSTYRAYGYKEGKLRVVGKVMGEKRIGEWVAYDSLSNIIESKEYVIINGVQKLNRFKYLDNRASYDDCLDYSTEISQEVKASGDTIYNFDIKIYCSPFKNVRIIYGLLGDSFTDRSNCDTLYPVSENFFRLSGLAKEEIYQFQGIVQSFQSEIIPNTQEVGTHAIHSHFYFKNPVKRLTSGNVSTYQDK